MQHNLMNVRPRGICAVLEADERLVDSFVAKRPHLSYENLTRGATFSLCYATWYEIARAWAQHDLERGRA